MHTSRASLVVAALALAACGGSAGEIVFGQFESDSGPLPPASGQDAEPPDGSAGPWDAGDLGRDASVGDAPPSTCPSDQKTCAGKCGLVVDDCARRVDCGPCARDGGVESGIADASDDAPPSNTCASPNACATAADIGQVSGDVGSTFVTATERTSKWLRVRVTENDSTLTGVRLRADVMLTSPPGANYDLYVWEAGCATLLGSSTLTSAADSVVLQWGEAGIADGTDNSRDLIVEVRPVSGRCEKSDGWKLQVTGN